MSERSDLAALRARFAWDLPARFNIGAAIGAWGRSSPERPALIEAGDPDAPGRDRVRTFGELAQASDRLANALRGRGVARGDRVAILLPQGFEAVVAHLAAYKLGAVAVPLALVFGPAALEYRLRRASAKALVTVAQGAAKLSLIEKPLPALEHVLVSDAPLSDATSLSRALRDAAPAFEAVDTTPDDPAMMIFTSGTTGPPKGALHGHRVLLGHLPGIRLAQEGMPQPDDLLWTPADWAWAGGLLNALLPALYWGVPVVAWPHEKFDAGAAMRLMRRLRVTNAFLPPTAIRLLRAGLPDADPLRAGAAGLALRAIGAAGETLGADTFRWAARAFGVPVNEFYGQTECNAVLGSSWGAGVSRAGAIGQALPGHRVAILDEEGQPVPAGSPGTIAVDSPDPVMFLGYWEDEAATRAKFSGSWWLTGDQAVMDAEGYVCFIGRDDDLITSSGYRIGPSEIEDTLSAHPAVRMAVAVGKPDPLRTEIVKAYVVLRDANAASPELADAIRLWVRERLSAHEYPREISFVDAVPLTASGKVIRRAFREDARREAERA